MKRHANIPIFIPHLGCPNQCVFCNQHKITGVAAFSADSVRGEIENALSTIKAGVKTEIAFFGGSFTGIDRELMCELLRVAYSFVEEGRVSSIRCSTRPDYINDEILRILKNYGVKIIELGLQSVDEDVLFAAKRGHTASDEEYACRLIKQFGFSLVGQMMIGLPGSTPETEERTARFIIDMGADAARIYPTVVFRETELCDMAERGIYKSLSEDEAVIRSARVLTLFRDAGVEVIRIGLCSGENLSDSSSYHSGPNHPALGELVENEFYYTLIKKKTEEMMIPLGSSVSVFVSPGSLSKAIGQKRKNKLHFYCLTVGVF